MGRPLKIQKLNAGVVTDAGFPQFANLDPGTQVVPVGMTSTEFLGVVGGANTGIATSTFPVVEITANVNGQQGAAYIITQKGATKYLVSGENSVSAGSFTPGFSYQILSLGDTDFTAIGAGINPQVGEVFTATGAGSGTGTASDCGQCQLVANATINSGEMNMVFSSNGGSTYATRLTNKYIWDNSNPPVRYAVNFFVSGETTAVTLTNVAVANTAGWFTSDATTFVVGQALTVAGTLTGNATITGYTDPTTYFVIGTNGTTTFQLSSTYNGSNIATAAGNTRGLTFSEAVSTTAKSGADIATWTNATGDLTLAQVQNYTS
jgi:hypothetical protein